MNAKTIMLELLSTTFLLWSCTSGGNTCPLPQDGFSKANLVGTWVAKRLESTDTLVIRADGTYKQIIHLETPAVDYESEWLTWQLEYSKSGIPYLHMEGLHLCAYLPDIIDCEQIGGGGSSWYDFCQEESVQMFNEGILIVLESPATIYNQSPGDINLTLLLAWPERVWKYELVKP